MIISCDLQPLYWFFVKCCLQCPTAEIHCVWSWCLSQKGRYPHLLFLSLNLEGPFLGFFFRWINIFFGFFFTHSHAPLVLSECSIFSSFPYSIVCSSLVTLHQCRSLGLGFFFWWFVFNWLRPLSIIILNLSPPRISSSFFCMNSTVWHTQLGSRVILV